MPEQFKHAIFNSSISVSHYFNQLITIYFNLDYYLFLLLRIRRDFSLQKHQIEPSLYMSDVNK